MSKHHEHGWTAVILTMAVWLVSHSALAQEHRGDALEEHGEHFHKNEVAVLLGVTYEAEAGENLFATGLEYAHQFNSRVRAAAAVEYSGGVGGWVFVLPVGVRLYRGLSVTAGPGIEHFSRRGGDEHETAGADNLFLFRVGAVYVFELGERYSISPGVAYDWIREEHGTATAIVYGVKIGIGF